MPIYIKHLTTRKKCLVRLNQHRKVRFVYILFSYEVTLEKNKYHFYVSLVSMVLIVIKLLYKFVSQNIHLQTKPISSNILLDQFFPYPTFRMKNVLCVEAFLKISFFQTKPIGSNISRCFKRALRPWFGESRSAQEGHCHGEWESGDTTAIIMMQITSNSIITIVSTIMVTTMARGMVPKHLLYLPPSSS